MATITDLPYECLVLIFNYLKAKDIINLRKTCTVFREVVKYVKCSSETVNVSKLKDIFWQDELIYGFTKYKLNIFKLPRLIFNSETEITTFYHKDISIFNGIKSLTLHGAKDVSTLRDIECLNLVNCKARNVILHDSIRSLTFSESLKVSTIIGGENLTHLNIGATSIFDVSSFKNLVYLNVSKNKKITIICNLPRLKKLEACNSSVYAISNLESVEEIDCNNTHLEVLRGTPNLRVFSASFARIGDISHLSNLEVLNLFKCDNVTGLQFLNKLKSVNLAYNYSIKSFKGLENVEEITCEGKMEDIDCLRKVKRMTLIYCNCDVVSDLPELEELVIRRCNISSIRSLPKLKKLYLHLYLGKRSSRRYNNSEFIVPDYSSVIAIRNLPNLKNIIINDYKIGDDKGRLIYNLPKEYLSITCQYLREIDNLPSLTYLSFTNTSDVGKLGVDII